MFIKSCDFRAIFVGVYMMLFGSYLVIGAQPVRANDYEISANLAIPSIDLASPVTTLQPHNGILNTPDYIAGSYQKYLGKTLIIGHSTTVFQNLNRVKTGDSIIYDNHTFQITNTAIIAKSDINMQRLLLTADTDTIIIMTCAGTDLGNGDATHRLLVTATATPLANVL